MDPISIAEACVGLTTTIAKASGSIAQFVRTVRGARQDLALTSRQLGELAVTLALVHGEGDAEKLPETFHAHIESVLQNCESILEDIIAILATCKGGAGLGSTRWALVGKEEVACLDRQLDAHLRTLNIAVEASMLLVAHSLFLLFSCISWERHYNN